MKVEIVSPPFPPDTPQVILENQSRLMNGAKFVPAILRKVARKYRNLLLQNVLFNGKLLDLTVMIHPIDSGHDNRTSGEYYGEGQRGRMHAIIDMYVNISDSPQFVAYVFAHELSHMLVCTRRCSWNISDRSKDGCEPGSSCINRYLPSEPDFFGRGLEESIADNLAMYVISRCRFSDEAGTYAQFAQEFECRQGFASLLAAAFGDPLKECKYIDEVAEIPIEAENYSDSKTDKAPYTCNRVFIRNKFWFCVAVNQFHWVIDAYNDIMGNGAWRKLCRHMDAVQNEIASMGFSSEAGRKHQRLAEQTILEFTRKYAADQDNSR